MTRSFPRRVVVVIPTYNEADTLPDIVADLAELGVPGLSILVVDDSSPDGTAFVARELAERYPLDVVERRHKDGLGAAYIVGMSHALAAGADVVVQMDADGSHPADAVPAMIDALWLAGADVAVGSRYVAGGSTDPDWPRRRRALSRWANVYVRTMLDLDVRDATAGFKAWRAHTLRVVDPMSVASRGYSFQFELAHRVRLAGLTTVEVPIRFIDRTKGRSKMSLAVQAEALRTPWHLRSSGWRPPAVVLEPAG